MIDNEQPGSPFPSSNQVVPPPPVAESELPQDNLISSDEQSAALSTVRNFRVGKDEAPPPPKKHLFLGVAIGLAIIVLGTFGFFYLQMMGRRPEPTTTPVTRNIVLNYWGLWEHDATLTEVFEGFEAENPGVTVKYTKKNIDHYRQDLMDAFDYAGMNAPDVFRFHASWRSTLDANLASIPTAVISKEAFASQFYPVMTTQLTDLEGNLKGIPLMYDSLALVYNKDIFARAGAEVPRSWPELRLLASSLTQADPGTGRILQAGAALGLGTNVDFATDIIGLMAAQRGINWSVPDANIVDDAISYYASFYVNPDTKTWDNGFSSSIQAFAEGKVAMTFVPSWTIHDILKLNPVLPIGVAPVPQLNPSAPVNWATYWVEGVNVKGSYQDAAWRLLQYLARPEVLEKLNQEQKLNRDFGEIYPRVAMADRLASDAYTQPYLVNAYTAVGFPLNDKTFDDGINDTTGRVVLNALAGHISAYEEDGDITSVGRRFGDDWQEILQQYGYVAGRR